MIAASQSGSVDLRSHQQRTVEFVAEDILGRRKGERILTTAEYQRIIGVGSGTVQRALSMLESIAAVQLSRHGHLGTKIVEVDLGGLWRLTGRGQVRVVATLPGAVDAFGLSKGLHTQLEKLGVPIDLRYRRGADARARLVLRNDADLAVMSRGAAEELPPRLRKPTAMIELGPASYYAPGSLVRLSRAGRKRSARVGVDRGSHDHRKLTEAEFPRVAKYVDCPYTHLPGALLEDRIDIGVWHRTLLPTSVQTLGLVETPLTGDGIDALLDEVSPAVLVVRAEDAALRNVLDTIDVRAILRTQRALLDMDPAAQATHDAVWSR